jgi:hypothetical protein
MDILNQPPYPHLTIPQPSWIIYMADDVDPRRTSSAIRYVPNMQPKAPNDRSTVSEFVDTVLAGQDPYSVLAFMYGKWSCLTHVTKHDVRILYYASSER